MSISKNIGRFARSLSKLRSTKGYFKTKSVTLTVLQHLPLVGKPLSNLLVRVKVGLKAALYGSNYFENLGLRYFGPVDGNNEAAVERLLEEAKESGQSCVIHVKTKKGKGYAPAEANPDQYHGLAPANAPTFTDPGFSEEMGAWLTAYAYKNEKVCAITAAMAGGTGLNKFRSAYPSRFFDVGIAEEHAVTFAAGLAANGFRPVVAIYSSFLQRAYDNLIHDVALQNLPVIFCVDRAGLNASDGATHHGIFDVAFLAQIPNMRLCAPVTRAGIGVAMEQAFKQNGPVAIRYPNGHEDSAVAEAFYGDSKPTEIGVRQWLPDGEKRSPEALIVTHGRIVKEALKAANALEKERIRTGVLLLEQLCPYQETAQKLLSYLPEEPCKLLFLEEEIYAGGMGMMLSDTLRPYDVMKNKTVSVLALPEGFGIQDRAEPIWHSFGLDAEGIVKRILSL
jgi:1-deoxy-D-xylulose-5-phosphate synthase